MNHTKIRCSILLIAVLLFLPSINTFSLSQGCKYFMEYYSDKKGVVTFTNPIADPQVMDSYYRLDIDSSGDVTKAEKIYLLKEGASFYEVTLEKLILGKGNTIKIKSEYNKNGTVKFNCNYEYNGNGNIGRIVRKNVDGTINMTINYKYDDSGNLSEEIWIDGQKRLCKKMTYH